MIRETDIGNEVKLRKATLNPKELQGSFSRLVKLAREMDITGIYKTWVRVLVTDIMSHMSESENTISEKDG